MRNLSESAGTGAVGRTNRSRRQSVGTARFPQFPWVSADAITFPLKVQVQVQSARSALRSPCVVMVDKEGVRREMPGKAKPQRKICAKLNWQRLNNKWALVFGLRFLFNKGIWCAGYSSNRWSGHKTVTQTTALSKWTKILAYPCFIFFPNQVHSGFQSSLSH